MIGHYLSSNNEMCYSVKTQTFSPTKHTLNRKSKRGPKLNVVTLEWEKEQAKWVREQMVKGPFSPWSFIYREDETVVYIYSINWGRML